MCLTPAGLPHVCLPAGAASKLAGRLAFAASCTFRRLGRAMIKPVYNQQYSRTGAVGSTLETALRWWLHVLTQGITESRPWKMPVGSPVRIYVDAASTPAHCAAVMVHARHGKGQW